MSRGSTQKIIAALLGAFLLWGASAVYADSAPRQTNVDQARHGTNAKGVPQLTVDGLGAVDHPAWVALYALAYAGVEDYDPSLGLKADPQRFEASIAWLKASLSQNKQGRWVWPYRFDSTYNDVTIKAPWASAFAQAAGIQALLAHWKRTQDKSSLALAQKAAESLFIPLGEGGFLFSADKDIWFEEIPSHADNPSHILNGHMRALLALGELKDATGEARYQEWFDKGMNTLVRWLPLYDTGYWLRYDLNPRKQELLFRLANPYGFANPELAIDRIVLRDPVSGEESVLDVGGPNDAEGPLRIAGNDWGQIERVDGRTVRRLRPVEGGREAQDTDGQMVSPFTYFYLKLPGQWKDNLRKAPYELSVEYLDEKPGNLEIQMRSIAPGQETFRAIKNGGLLISGKGVWRKWRIEINCNDLGYWVGRSYAIRHKSYLELLAKKDGRLASWVANASTYLRAIGSSEEFELVTRGRIDLPPQTPVLPLYSLDKNGVVLMHMPNPADVKDNIGIPVYSPYIIATQAIDGKNMAGLDGFLAPLGIEKERVSKGAALNWLLNEKNQNRTGDAVVYPFEFDNIYNDVITKAPWPSAFAQNYVLKALNNARGSANSRVVEIERAIKGVLKSYEFDISEGGIASVSEEGFLFFEEVPSRTHVLNAHVSSIPILNESAKTIKNSEALDSMRKGLEALRKKLHLFDTGYWLRYDLNPKKELLFQMDWLWGENSPLIESISFEAPQFAKRVQVQVGRDDAFEGASRISGLEWLPAQIVDGVLVRPFDCGYSKHRRPVSGGTLHNVYALMQLPELKFADYFDVRPHRLVIRYKDVAAGKFIVKVQSIHEGNVLEFTPLRNSVIKTIGDQRWKEAVMEVRPQDMGWYKGPDYQAFEVSQLKSIADMIGEWFFEQYAERQEYFLDAKNRKRSVIIEPMMNEKDVAVKGFLGMMKSVKN